MTTDFMTIADAARLIEKRELSPVELIENRLQRIQKYDGEIHSFIYVMAEQAREAARVAEKEIMAGKYKGPLHGIPIGLKDIYETAGVPTTAHSKILQNNIPTHDAHAVKQLKNAGAIILGKLATHEFALGGPSFDLPWPPARNPWNTEHFTGGSSSGSGAAVAAGFVLGSAAGDTGGSIRGPSALCGLAGLKPSYGLVSRTGMLPLAYSLDHAGPMAWTAEDCALMLQAMAGHDPADPVSLNRPVPDYRSALNNNLKGLRVGLLRHFYTKDNEANSETRDAIDNAAKKLEEMGCIVKEMTVSPLADWTSCGTLIMLAEAYAIHETNLRERFLDYGEVFRGRMVLGGLFTSADYIQALRRRQELIHEFDQAMADLDVIVTAVSPSQAPKLDTVRKFSIIEKPLLTTPFNVTGSPAMSVCCGFANNGLPLAMQVVGKRYDDATVLRVADAFEKVAPWREKRPLLSCQPTR